MANNISLKTVRSDFDKKLVSAKELFDAVQPFATGNQAAIQGQAALFPGQARRVVGLSFMLMVMALEDLVEAAFVRYIAGAKAPNGTGPNLRLSRAASMPHAYQLLSGDPDHKPGTQYLTWSDWGATIKLAKVFFEDGLPFGSVSLLERSRLADAVKIRNRVAHFSAKCRNDFNTLARSYMGLAAGAKLPQGFTVGQMLVEKSNKHFGNGCGTKFYFDHFHKLFGDVADKICPK